MADDLKIKVTGIVEADEKKSGELIASQMERISRIVNAKSKIKIAVEIDPKSIKNLTSTINKEMAGASSGVGKAVKDWRQLTLDMRNLKLKDKTGILDWKLFDKAKMSKDFNQAKFEYGVLSKTFRNLGTQMTSDLPSNVLENLPSKIDKASLSVKRLSDNFKILKTQGGTVPDDIGNRLSTVGNKLKAVKSKPITEASIEEFGKITGEIDKLENKYKSLSSTMRVHKMDIGATKLKTDIKSLTQDLLNMKKEWSAFTKDPALLIKYDNAMNKVKGAKTRPELTAARAEVQLLKKEIQGEGLDRKNIWGEMFNNVKKFTSWFLIGGGVASVVRGFKEITGSVKELNAALVDIQMATNLPKKEAKELLKTYAELGKQLGATTAQVASSATDWLRQGYTQEQTNTLIQNSMVLSKVGSIESAQATEYLTTAMKGYNVTVEDSIGIVDKLSAVDLVSATSAGGLAEGMSQVANNARMAGISMEKLLGYLAAVGETTGGSASSIGTTLSTIFTRMGNIKLSKLDSYSNDGEDLSNVETVLQGKGIKLRDSVNEFRNFGDVLDDVASRWESFDSVSQRAIASAIAGVRQYEEFAVLMNNYGKATEYTAVATNSSGTAMQKFGYHLESVSAKEAKATAAFELLSDTVLSSDLIGGFYDTKAGLLGFLTGIVENLGLIPTLLTAVTAAASFKNAGISNEKYAPFHLLGAEAKTRICWELNKYRLATA